MKWLWQNNRLEDIKLAKINGFSITKLPEGIEIELPSSKSYLLFKPIFYLKYTYSIDTPSYILNSITYTQPCIVCLADTFDKNLLWSEEITTHKLMNNYQYTLEDKLMYITHYKNNQSELSGIFARLTYFKMSKLIYTNIASLLDVSPLHLEMDIIKKYIPVKIPNIPELLAYKGYRVHYPLEINYLIVNRPNYRIDLTKEDIITDIINLQTYFFENPFENFENFLNYPEKILPLQLTHFKNIIHYLKAKSFKYVPTNFLISGHLAKLFNNYNICGEFIKNPSSALRNYLTTKDKYWQLLEIGGNYQNKGELRIYTYVMEKNYLEISGIIVCENKNPCKLMVEVIPDNYNFTYSESKKEFFSLNINLKNEHVIGSMGIFDTLHRDKLKLLKYHRLKNIIYFKYQF